MSIASIAGSVAAALPELSIHAHIHKKGVHSASGDSSDSTQPASGSTQNLFGNLLQSIEQVIGMSSPATASSGTTPATAVQPNTQTQSAATQLQNYLKNAPQNLLNTNISFDSKA